MENPTIRKTRRQTFVLAILALAVSVGIGALLFSDIAKVDASAANSSDGLASYSWDGDSIGVKETKGQSETKDNVDYPDQWTPDVDCTICHTIEAESFVVTTGGETNKSEASLTSSSSDSSADSSDGESVDSQAPLATHHVGVVCMTCHNDEEGLREAHEGVTKPKTVRRLKWTFVTTDACLACHGSWEDIAEQTQDSTLCTDSRGTVVNPHGAPESHINGDNAYLHCYDCHDMHNSEDVAEKTKSACSTCHHADVYECHTCHE